MNNNISFAKKICAQILTLAIILTAISCVFTTGLNVGAETAALDIWDVSTKATSFAGGDGSEKSPYQISTPEQLAYLVGTYTANYGGNTGGKYFELTNDIYLNNVEDENWQTNTPNQWCYSTTASYSFSGIFDGKGYTVYGIYRNDTPATADGNNATGLFPYVANSARIHNVNVRKSYISGVNYAGGIVGRVFKNGESTTVISGCSVDDTVTVNAWSAGGIIGGTRLSNIKLSDTCNIIIDNCWYVGNKDTLSGTNATAFTGGISNGYVKIKNSWFVSDKAATKNATLTNVYGTTAGTYSNTTVNVLTADQMKGEAAKTNMPTLNWALWNTDANGGYPYLPTIPLWYEKIWDGKVATSTSTEFSGFAGGDGKEESPYQISTPQQLAYLVGTLAATTDWGGQTGGKYYELTNDIYLNNVVDDNWQTNTPNAWYEYDAKSKVFGGVFNGNGYTVYGIYINNTPATNNDKLATGLFPSVVNASKIYDVNVRESYISGTYIAGGIVGRVYKNWDSTTVISGCSVDETVTVKGNYAGGILGYNATGSNYSLSNDYPIVIENCYYIGTAETLVGNGNLFGAITAGNHTVYQIKNSYSVSPKKVAQNAVLTNVYGTTATTTTNGTTVNVINADEIKGESAVSQLTNLAFGEVWYPVENSYPNLIVNGRHICDVNGNGLSDDGDFNAMRNHLLEMEKYYLTDLNADGATDIRDLVYLNKKVS